MKRWLCAVLFVCSPNPNSSAVPFFLPAAVGISPSEVFTETIVVDELLGASISRRRLVFLHVERQRNHWRNAAGTKSPCSEGMLDCTSNLGHCPDSSFSERADAFEGRVPAGEAGYAPRFALEVTVAGGICDIVCHWGARLKMRASQARDNVSHCVAGGAFGRAPLPA